MSVPCPAAQRYAMRGVVHACIWYAYYGVRGLNGMSCIDVLCVAMICYCCCCGVVCLLVLCCDAVESGVVRCRVVFDVIVCCYGVI